MRTTNRIVRGLGVTAIVAVLATSGGSGAGYGVNSDTGSMETFFETQMTERVIGGQYIGTIPTLFILQGLCVRCLVGVSASQQSDIVDLVRCAVTCYVAF